jgi:hypothetical protein
MKNKQTQLKALEKELIYLRSLVLCFETGELPHNSSLTHAIYAQWGRRRLEEKKKKPALLGQ